MTFTYVECTQCITEAMLCMVGIWMDNLVHCVLLGSLTTNGE